MKECDAPESKKNSGRSGMDIERTKHNFQFLYCCILRQVVHPSSVRRRLLVTTLPLGSLLVGFLRAIVR
jgi:hypothetical protein